jgi:LmbE family N-acetylglucosaminyl deacetylase
MKKIVISLCVALINLSVFAQTPSSGEIKQGIKKLGVLGSVLYFAAHPDDENTRIISYYANEKLYETAYFSLTRGDGGQNLIGDEKGDLLGVIRTQELLQARNIDGGDQYFSRAVDFGYSKTVDETLEKWNEDSILYDAVWVIRQFQPDVIITRFPPDANAGHGHHTASAVVAIKAMDLAADPSVFPDQLDRFAPWQVQRLFINTGKWWEPDIDSLYIVEPGRYAKVNIGEYNAVLGQSYSEIAGMSRSQHKSQGFGAALSKGDYYEYLELNKGVEFQHGIMDGVDTTWNRIGGSKKIQKEIEHCYTNFDENEPWKSVDHLIKIRDLISEVKDDHWKKVKTNEIDELIQDCLGLVVEVLSEDEMWVLGSKEKLSFNILNRSPYPLKINKIQSQNFDSSLNSQSLMNNQWFEFTRSISLVDDRSSHPYWLRNEHDAFFQISDKGMTGVPEKSIAPRFMFSFELKEGKTLELEVPVSYKTVDRVKGELVHTVFISPEIIIHPVSDMVVFKPGEKKNIDFLVTSYANLGDFEFYPGVSSEWKASSKIEGTFESNGKPVKITVEIEAPMNGSEFIMKPYVKVQDKVFNQDRIVIDYDHIEAQMLTPEVFTKLISLDVIIEGEHIAYIEGAGDEVPAMLREMGYHVSFIEFTDLSQDLQQYDAIVFGVRAYNVHPEMAIYHDNIMEYVNKGGRVLMQYNTSRGMDIPLGPYPFELSRSRVTDEFAQVTFNDPQDPILSYPNKITLSDFDGWVQERGLYFADKWSDEYRAPISWNDPGEEAHSGSLLISDYGKGVYVYTSISFFRQLPAGVPGAFRLMSNLLSGGKEKENAKKEIL